MTGGEEKIETEDLVRPQNEKQTKKAQNKAHPILAKTHATRQTDKLHGLDL